MRLALLLHRQYAPYQKWLGTAFGGCRTPTTSRRSCTPRCTLPTRTVARQRWERPTGASPTATTPPASRRCSIPVSRDYHARPAQVLMADRFVRATLAAVHDPWLRSLPLIGAVDQFVDSTDLLRDPDLWQRAASAYGSISPAPDQQ
jgi:hypothetical protein